MCPVAWFSTLGRRHGVPGATSRLLVALLFLPAYCDDHSSAMLSAMLSAVFSAHMIKHGFV